MTTRSCLQVVGAVLLSCLACTSEPPPSYLAEAETLVLDQRWNEARDLLKRHLMHYPEDAGAHFYLGRCYMMGEPLWPVVAEGEFQTALQLFYRQGKESPLERYPPKVFEWFCYKEMAVTLLLQMDRLMESGIRPRQFRPLIEQARYYYERALELQDDPDGLAQMDVMLRDLERRAGLSRTR